MTVTTAEQDADAAIRLADFRPAEAVPVARAAAARAHAEDDPIAGAKAERALGHALLICDDIDAAIRHLRVAIACAGRARSVTLAGEARMKLAYALSQLGRLRPALREADAAVAVLDGVPGGRARAQRAAILHELGRLDDALCENHLALATLRRAGDLLGTQRLLINRALVRVELGALAAARADLLEAHDLAVRLDRPYAIGLIVQNLGVVEMMRGDVPAALAHLDRAEQLIPAGGGRLSVIHRDRAELLLSVGLVTEARAAAERAVAAVREQRRLLKLPELRLLLAQAAYLDHDWPTARAQAALAVRELTRQGRPDWAALARLEVLRAALAGDGGAAPRIATTAVEALAATLAGSGRPAAAIEAHLAAARLALRRRRPAERHLAAASRARRHGPAALRARGWYAEALRRATVAPAGPTGPALAAVRRGLRILDEHHAAMGATDLRAHAAVHRAELAELGLRLAFTGGRPAAVLEWAERGRASHLLRRPVLPPDDDRLAGLLAQLRTLAREQRDAGGRHNQPTRRGRDADHGGARLTDLERRIRDHTRLRSGARSGPLPPPVRTGVLAAALGDWALVEFVRFEGMLHGLTLAGGTPRLRTVGPIAEIDQLVDRLPFALRRLAAGTGRVETAADVLGSGRAGDTRSAALTLLHEAARRLDRVLFAPLAGDLGDRPLVIVPTGRLHAVPWSVVPSCTGRPVAVAPSATLWHASLTAARSSTATAGAVAVAAGPRLPAAVAEAHAVAAAHGTTALVGEEATTAAVLKALGSADLVHLAAHGRLSAQNPLFSDLEWADGPLVVHDLEQLPQVPRTVVLAACDSGGSVVRTGDELLGLSATFIARGTAQLIASVVPVPDVPTAPFMVDVHRRLAAGCPPAVALAAAQQGLDGEDPSALAAGAGFVCLGAGRPGQP